MSVEVALLDSYSFLESITTRNSLSYLALAWLVWESIITFADEYDYIWRVQLWPTKLLFLFIRYFALISQIVNHFLTIYFLSLPRVSPASCRWWFGFQSLVVQLLYNAVQLVSMRTVHALYEQNTTIGTFLMILYSAEFLAMSIVWAHSIRSYRFDPTCILEKTPPLIAVMNIVIITVQAIIWSMTLRKRDIVYGGKGFELIQVLLRDGAVAWAAMTVFFSFVTPYTYFVKVLTHSMFSLSMTLVSIIGCRVILNIQDTRSCEEVSEFELTTVFTEETVFANPESLSPCEISVHGDMAQ